MPKIRSSNSHPQRPSILGGIDAATALALVALTFAFLFGGASRENLLRVTLVELAALPLFALAVTALVRSPDRNRHRLALGVVLALIALPLLQLLPLPASMWASLPGREGISPALQLQATTPGWIAFSLSPDQTWQAALALIPPIAIFLTPLARSPQLTRTLIWATLACAILSIGLGAAQFAIQGHGLYPWRTTDAGSVAGFFANRNHLATLCLATLPLAAVLFATASPSARTRRWLTAIYCVAAVAALALIRSRTGILLSLPVLLASLAAAWIAAGRPRPSLPVIVVGGLGIVLLLAIALFAATPALDRFSTADASGGNRLRSWPLVAETAQTHLPLGSGIGSFDPVYRSVEPLAEVDPTFFNHAHNEYLEVWLEAGWLGIGALVLFLVWFGRRAINAWRSVDSSSQSLPRAATISIMVVLLHSAVDYPLRTLTMSVVFALACAILEFGGGQQPAGHGRHRRRKSPGST